MNSRRVLDWLLDPSQPSVRYRALRDLEGRTASDGELRAIRSEIPIRGWAAEILAERRPGGWWVSDQSLYVPKYLSTNWRMLVLADLGLTRGLPAVRESCELWMARSPLSGGGVGGNSKGTGHHCFTANMARALLEFGYEEDPRVRRALEWLVSTADPKGGWSCFGSGRNLDSWEGLSAFAAYPREKWTAPMARCVEQAAEFFLERELHRQGGEYAPWYRFHYPIHYYYDLLVGLDLLTALGYTDDPRLRFALSILEEKRRADGRWNLDAQHPDVEGPIARWYDSHPKRRPTPFELERAGAPSRMVTLRALTVLARVEGTVPSPRG